MTNANARGSSPLFLMTPIIYIAFPTRLRNRIPPRFTSIHEYA